VLRKILKCLLRQLDPHGCASLSTTPWSITRTAFLSCQRAWIECGEVRWAANRSEAGTIPMLVFETSTVHAVVPRVFIDCREKGKGKLAGDLVDSNGEGYNQGSILTFLGFRARSRGD
jgi:hypothetical protein